MPRLSKKIIESPSFNLSPSINLCLGFTIPKHAPARSMAFLSIIPESEGVSPPPQDAPAKSHAFAQPVIKSDDLFLSLNHSELPTAQYAAMLNGLAPTVIRSLTMYATVS